jgi:hypothetical protein
MQVLTDLLESKLAFSPSNCSIETNRALAYLDGNIAAINNLLLGELQ